MTNIEGYSDDKIEGFGGIAREGYGGITQEGARDDKISQGDGGTAI